MLPDVCVGVAITLRGDVVATEEEGLAVSVEEAVSLGVLEPMIRVVGGVNESSTIEADPEPEPEAEDGLGVSALLSDDELLC